VLAVVISLVLVLFGLVSVFTLGVREYPDVDPPIVTITTNYAGASPDVIDAAITEPLEQAINGVAGIRTMSSTSRDGASEIRVEFDLDVSLSEAANDVRDKVALARRSLPLDAEAPIVEKADADASPIIFMPVFSGTKSVLEVSDIADRLIRERVQTIPGVASVRIFGEKRYAMWLRLDAERMAAHGVTPMDVANALDRENVDLPAGRVEGASIELGIRAESRLTTPEEFARMVIRSGPGRPVRLEDVGRAELGAENPRSSVKRQGLPMVSIALLPQPGANAIAIADEFYSRLDEIRRQLPPDVEVDVGYDFTTYVRRSIKEVEETLLIAFGLVAVVILFFLRDFRAMLVPVVAIPVSIVATFFVMYLAGFTINILTLVGLVLAIGLVCDDAIVVLENVYRKIEDGASPLDAALEGTREVYSAVIATTLALVAVFVPVVFLGGLTGRLFREFGIVVAGSVGISALVALSLSPMMCRFVLSAKPSHDGWLYRLTEPVLGGITRGYSATVRGFVRVRWLAVVVLGLASAGSYFAFKALPRELAPLEDRSNVRVAVKAPEGATFEYTAAALDRIATRVDAAIPEVSRSFAITARGSSAVNTGFFSIYLTEPHQRTRSQEQIFQELSKLIAPVDDVRVFPSQPPTIGARFAGQPLQYVIQAPTLDALVEVLPKFVEAAQGRPELRFVDSDFKLSRPELKLEVNRAKAADLRVGIQDVARTLQLGFGEQRVGYFLMQGRQYRVMAQLERRERDAPDDVSRLFVRSQNGEMIGLDNLVESREGVAPSAIYRFDRSVAATISAGMAPGKTLGDGIDAMDEVAREILPAGYRTSLAGEARDFQQSSSSLAFAFGLAILLAYLVLAAQFDSFLDPLVIMLTVPLSLVGGLGSLVVTGASLNVFSQIGLIMLIGLITKNGILIVEFANQAKARGVGPVEAALEAAETRFRPVLMTSVATVLGVSPIAFSLGTASGSRQSLGIAVMGGMVIGTLFTLYVVPALYALLSPQHRREVLGDDEPVSAGQRTAAE
jgi:multidrug efflux pump